MVTVILADKKYQFEGKIRGIEILKTLGLNEEAYILVKDDELCPIDEHLEDCEVEIIPVISGGNNAL